MKNKLNFILAIGFYICQTLPGQTPDNFSTPLVGGLTRQLFQDPIILNPKMINILFAPDAMQTPGIKQFGPQSTFDAKRFWLIGFTKVHKIQWNISSPSQGDYYVDFLINSKPGTQIKVTGPLNSILYTASSNGWQRETAKDVLKLPSGSGTVSLQLVNAKDTIEIKSIELVNIEEKKNIDKRVKAFKGDATWMKDAGYGIMFQAGGWSYPPTGDKKPWPGFAEDFDVKAFVQKIRDMGGKYIVWSATWGKFLFPAPIKSIDEILPNNVSKRDLIGDLINECQKYDIRFMMYYHFGHGNKELMLAKGWIDSPVQTYESRQKWISIEEKIFTEIGNRYGKGLDAIFLDDGCCWYPTDFEKLGAAMKTGNPKRLICYNPWIGPSHTTFQDFYCGEGFDGKVTPYKLENGFVSEGAQKGLQLFGNFIFDGPGWGISRANIIIKSPKGWSADKIVEMTKRLEKERYSVAINILMYEDGTVGADTYNMLKEAALKLKRGN